MLNTATETDTIRRRGSSPGRSAGNESADPVYAMPNARVDQFLKEYTRWVANQDNIQAVALVGSYARGTATEASDVDLVVVANDPALYLQERSWTHVFGEVWNQEVEGYGKVISLRVQYTDGLEVEYGLTDETWAAFPPDEGTRELVAGGMRVLFERWPLLSRHI